MRKSVKSGPTAEQYILQSIVRKSVISTLLFIVQCSAVSVEVVGMSAALLRCAAESQLYSC